jgi:hypothetical protein
MLLNSHLYSNNKILINGKIIHLVMPTASNLLIPGFFPKKLAGQSLKNMIISMREKLKINPVFFSLVNLNSFDNLYHEMFEYNNSIPIDEINTYKKNYEKNVDFIVKLLSIDSVEFGKKIWDIEKDNII